MARVKDVILHIIFVAGSVPAAGDENVDQTSITFPFFPLPAPFFFAAIFLFFFFTDRVRR